MLFSQEEKSVETLFGLLVIFPLTNPAEWNKWMTLFSIGYLIYQNWEFLLDHAVKSSFLRQFIHTRPYPGSRSLGLAGSLRVLLRSLV